MMLVKTVFALVLSVVLTTRPVSCASPKGQVLEASSTLQPSDQGPGDGGDEGKKEPLPTDVHQNSSSNNLTPANSDNNTAPVSPSSVTANGIDTTQASQTPVTLGFSAAYLYTKAYENGQEFEIISTDNETISKSKFGAGAKTYIIIHGFASRASKPWIITLKNEILERDPGSNVVAVEWVTPFYDNYTEEIYNKTVPYIPPLGASVASLVTALHNVKHLDYKDVHIIGLNLGAHIAGFAGKKCPIPIGRITGLEPASVGFLNEPATQRLDKSDAYYVDIMHTNSCNNWNVWDDCFGIHQSIGHTDFWPNGGFYQPACKHKKNEGLRCDHQIVTQYFIESFAYTTSDTRFLARPARNYYAYNHDNVSCGAVPQYMGILADPNAIYGDYFLNTSRKPPYAREDWRCPTRFRLNLYQWSCSLATVALIVLSVFPCSYIILCLKYFHSNIHKFILQKSAYSRFGSNEYGSNNDDISNQPPIFRVDCRSPISRFYDDLSSRPQTPMSIPESTDAYVSASEMSVRTSERSNNPRDDRRDGSRSVEELVGHQDALSRGFYDRSANGLDDHVPARRKDKAKQRTHVDLCDANLASSDTAGHFSASRLAFDDAASEEGSINLWREMELQ